MYTNQQLKNLYKNGQITKNVYELLSDSTAPQDRNVELEKEKVELAKSSQDPVLLQKCFSKDIDESSEAYYEYHNREKAEGVALRKQASATIEEVIKQFESIARKKLRKAGVSKEQYENEIWQANPELFEKYMDAQRILCS